MDSKRTQTRKDLIIIVFLSIIVFLLGYIFDFFVNFVEWTRKYESKKIDEYLALLILLIICFAIFSFRRWRETRIEIEEHKKAKEEIQKLNKELQKNILELKEANKELEAFNHTVSHDLQTPLIVIGGFTKRFLKIYSDKLDTNMKDIINIINMQTLKMESFIKDLLSYSSSGRRQIKRTEIDMRNLTDNVLDELSPLIDGRRIEFVIKELPPAYGDMVLMKQVFTNLISNAIKFTRQRYTGLIEVGYKKNGGDVYYVKDNGVGFSREDVDKLFTLFQRLHDSKKYEGTGIGLSIVQRIITRHGGKVWAEGDVDKGATFYFSLPKYDKKETLEPVGRVELPTS